MYYDINLHFPDDYVEQVSNDKWPLICHPFWKMSVQIALPILRTEELVFLMTEA